MPAGSASMTPLRIAVSVKVPPVPSAACRWPLLVLPMSEPKNMHTQQLAWRLPNVGLPASSRCIVSTISASLTVPTPAAYARSAVAAIGYGARANPYWAHDLALGATAFLPEALAVKIVADMHHAIRKRGLKKLAEKNKAK